MRFTKKYMLMQWQLLRSAGHMPIDWKSYYIRLCLFLWWQIPYKDFVKTEESNKFNFILRFYLIQNSTECFKPIFCTKHMIHVYLKVKQTWLSLQQATRWRVKTQSALAQNRLLTPLDYNYLAIKHSNQAPWACPQIGVRRCQKGGVIAADE